MKKGYKMIKAYGEASFIERKSRFIGYAMPVLTEEEAVSFINSIKKKHYDATHNCYAYILGETSNIQRSSDDGEPSGTAGIPILEVIRKEGLTNTAVVVTRYFGGIMLGAGGLIRAYTEGAAIGIKAAGTILVEPFAMANVHIEYPYLNKLQYELPKLNYIISSIEYNEIVTMKLLAPESMEQQIADNIAELTNGNALVESLGVKLLKLDTATREILND